jgi:glycosyltransferase involved in cell wall biosynthesis
VGHAEPVSDVVVDLTDGTGTTQVAPRSDMRQLRLAAHAPPSVSVVIPTLNEAENLPHVLPLIPSWVSEVIIVDGGSTDATVEVVEQLRPDARLIVQGGRGKGRALAEGFAVAAGDIIVMLDADGSTDPAEIPRYVAALRTGADFAKGTRFVIGGGSADITMLRRAGNSALARLVNLLWRTRFSDLCYGYNAFWRSHLQVMALDCPGFEVETLLNIRAASAGLKIVEVPSYEHGRLHGVSNLSAGRDGVRILRTILAERLRPR